MLGAVSRLSGRAAFGRGLPVNHARTGAQACTRVGGMAVWKPSVLGGQRAFSAVIGMTNVSFEYEYYKPILDAASFSIEEGSKVTLMGQNGSGKSTIFKLLNRSQNVDDGRVDIVAGATVATAQQVMAAELKQMSVEAYFRHHVKGDITENGFNSGMNAAMKAVGFFAPLDRLVGSFSGGQQARLLLAACLMQDSDILLLDEPTNNLDSAGIDRLIEYIIMSPKTVLVISHDADFLNAISDGVIYLDKYTQKIEQYYGNYFVVEQEIEARIRREIEHNEQQQKAAKAKKDMANKFSNKNRDVAAKMKQASDKAEEELVDVRKVDVAIKAFTIPCGAGRGVVATLNSLTVCAVGEDFEKVSCPLEEPVKLKAGQRLRLSGPNGIGKTTLLEALAGGTEPGASIATNVDIGYYRQDFSSLDFTQTVFESLSEFSTNRGKIHAVGASFHLFASSMQSRVGTLSEGQKGLLAFARLVLQRPGLLILDEPTNHINFRHLPVIAKALDGYEGAILLVSHDSHFVSQLRVDATLDLGQLLESARP